MLPELTFLTILVPAVEEATHTVTMTGFFERECKSGRQSACERLRDLEEGLVVQEKLNRLSGEFGSREDEHIMLSGRKPDLQAVYPLVMRDYFASGAGEEDREMLAEERLPECARHYHNYWINKKLWWPTADDGTPDWPAIYLYIVDHYYGYCLKKGPS